MTATRNMKGALGGLGPAGRQAPQQTKPSSILAFVCNARARLHSSSHK